MLNNLKLEYNLEISNYIGFFGKIYWKVKGWGKKIDFYENCNNNKNLSNRVFY